MWKNRNVVLFHWSKFCQLLCKNINNQKQYKFRWSMCSRWPWKVKIGSCAALLQKIVYTIHNNHHYPSESSLTSWSLGWQETKTETNKKYNIQKYNIVYGWKKCSSFQHLTSLLSPLDNALWSGCHLFARTWGMRSCPQFLFSNWWITETCWTNLFKSV